MSTVFPKSFKVVETYFNNLDGHKENWYPYIYFQVGNFLGPWSLDDKWVTFGVMFQFLHTGD